MDVSMMLSGFLSKKPMLKKTNETILLAKDEPLAREFVCHALETSGYRVLSATDGESALRLALDADTPIDLLLTDFIMPRMGGRELAERFRKVGFPALIFFVLTNLFPFLSRFPLKCGKIFAIFMIVL
jgi:CheY-like chemotaxis protein